MVRMCVTVYRVAQWKPMVVSSFSEKNETKNPASPSGHTTQDMLFYTKLYNYAEVSNLQPAGCMQPKMDQHKIVNLLKTLWGIFVITRHNVFNVWPKTTLLPAWPRDAKRLDTPDDGIENYVLQNIQQWLEIHTTTNPLQWQVELSREVALRLNSYMWLLS